MTLRHRLLRLLLRKSIRDAKGGIAELRRKGAASARFAGRVPKNLALEGFEHGGMRVLRVVHRDAAPRRMVLYLHGGGYVSGGIDSHLAVAVLLAQSAGVEVLLPEYRLAPEHPFPAALDDVLRLYRTLQGKGRSRARMAFLGDSAGGGLALAAALALKTAGEELPSAIVCISPWADLECLGESHASRAPQEMVLRTDRLMEWAAAYAGGEALHHPFLSPVNADLAGLPPLLIHVGSDEILFDDSTRLAAKARGAGVESTLRIWPGLWHDFPALGALVPESRLLFEETGRWLAGKA